MSFRQVYSSGHPRGGPLWSKCVNTTYSIPERAAILLATIACSVLAAMAVSETDVGLVIGVPIAIIANLVLFTVYVVFTRRNQP